MCSNSCNKNIFSTKKKTRLLKAKLPRFLLPKKKVLLQYYHKRALSFNQKPKNKKRMPNRKLIIALKHIKFFCNLLERVDVMVRPRMMQRSLGLDSQLICVMFWVQFTMEGPKESLVGKWWLTMVVRLFLTLLQLSEDDLRRPNQPLNIPS